VTLELMALRQCRLPDRVLEAWLDGNGRFGISGVVRRFSRAKAQRLGANGGNACGYRNPLGGTVVGTFSMSGLWVKTLDLLVSTTAACYVVTLLGASSRSSGSSRSRSGVIGGKSVNPILF
jgi:hypothetical protein